MNDSPTTQDPAKAEGSTAEICDVTAVKRRAKAGLVTMAVAVVVALVTLAAAAVTLLVTGLVPLSGLEGRIAAAIGERLGPDWQVEAETAELSRIDGQSQLRVRQVSFRHDSGATFRAPEAVLGYEPLALLRGEIRLVSVDLRGVNVRLGVDNNGALIVNADSAPAETPKTPVFPDSGPWNAFTAIMTAISTLAESNGLLGSLETAGMRGARLVLVDPEGRQRAGLEDVDLRLSRLSEGVSRLTMKGRVGERWKELAIDLSTDADGTRRAAIEIIRFEPAAAVALAFGSGGVGVEGLSLAGKASLTQKRDGQRAIEAKLDIRPGVLRFRDGPTEPVVIDGAHVELESVSSLNDIHIRSAELRAGATRLSGRGALSEENGRWRAQIDASGQIAGTGADPALAVARLQSRFTLDSSSGELQIDSLALRGPAIAADLTGTVQNVGGSPTQKLTIRARDSDARAVLAVWPAWTSPELHEGLAKQVQAGQVTVEVKLDLDAADHARLVKGGPMPDGALAVAIEATQVRFLPGDGLPPLVDLSLSGSATGRTMQLAIPKATADLGGGRQLALSEGSIVVPDTAIRRPPARIAFRSVGPVEALASMFSFPALKEFAPGPMDPAALRGASDLRTVLTLPLAPELAPGELVVQTSGTLSGLASDTLLGTEKLEGGNLAVSFDRTGLSARGEARLGGDRAQIELRQNAKGQGEATASLTLDNAARQKRGLGPEAGITGPVQVKVTKALGRNADAPPRIEIDLAKAAIDSAIPGFVKPAGRAGRVSFSYVLDADGPDLDDFVLDAAPVTIRGKIELNRQNGFESASLSQWRLSPGDNLKVEAKRDGAAIRLVIRGAVADARPFIRDLQTGSVAPARAPIRNAPGADLDIDLDVPILTGFNSEAIGNGVLKLSKRGGELRSLSFVGRIGRAGVTITQARQGESAGPLVVQSENGGALLRFFDFYRRAHGGDLVLSMAPAGARQSGDLLLRDFVVRDEPALKRVIGDQGGASNAGDRAGNAGGRVDASEVAFTKLRAVFTRSASRLDVSEMVIWGQQVGFTLEGNVDYGRDRVDIGGTFVPGYALNNAFAQIPVVGALLGGGSQYGGLFAVNFRISGSASAPTMTINPLSAIAPGILRRFVDPLGGAPLEQSRQPARPRSPAGPDR